MEWIRCRMCGALPAHDVGHGHALCGDCARKYQLSSCPTCGVTMLYQRAIAPAECSECRARAQLDDLPAERRDALDALVRERAWVRAMMLLREADPSLGLGDAQLLVSVRRAQLDVSLDPPLVTIDELTARAGALGPSAVEAVWDGDTVHDWFVVLLAIVRSPSSPKGWREEPLASLTQSHGDPSTLATHIGESVAASLGVPFFFGSPGTADDQAPRWWDARA